MAEGSILVVEDTADILELVCLHLEREGYSVYRAACCSSAFDVLSKYRIDLIITDLMLPEMTGLEFIYRVRRVVSYDRVPVIAMSAFDQKYLSAAMQAGAARILHKPEELDQLLPAVNQVLQQSGNNGEQSQPANVSGWT